MRAPSPEQIVAAGFMPPEPEYPRWRLVARLRQWWRIRQWAKRLAADVADLDD